MRLVAIEQSLNFGFSSMPYQDRRITGKHINTPHSEQH